MGEAVEILRRAWSGEQSISFNGKHYRLGGFHPGPPPAHAIEIWIGSYKPRMLRLTGRSGDGWLPSLPYAGPDEIPAMQRQIDDAAEAAGRDPRSIRRIYNVMGEITDGPVQSLLQGPPEHWVETLVHSPATSASTTSSSVPAARSPWGRWSDSPKRSLPPSARNCTEGRAPHPLDFVDSNPVNPQGEAMAAELRMVHDIIRRDLVVVRELAESVKEGASSEAVQARVEALAVSSPIWALQVSCLRYCRFVLGHTSTRTMPSFRPWNGLTPP